MKSILLNDLYVIPRAYFVYERRHLYEVSDDSPALGNLN